ncbi:FkbM family methyltransferase [Rhodanobacter sp. KK11]|jgi:FkbM family methyltransferase|uniref:FkbM family methyltransferase n=1 Tax=Rhodanobacter sp. KK11 TaxID=3083255 RepID=UPI00296759F3|nr:FkbM family methyltransferase [Rhodanobacter sp. KK11]MDW2980350.1 FkbM family methyltransferase [Rhodanobacter sp. KK11]
MKHLIAKVGKLAGILPVPSWRRALLRQHVAAGVEHAGVLRHLGALRMVVDVGANRGQFALAARHFFPQAKIVSFEPLAGPAAVYRAVFAGDARTTLVEAALGPQSGEAMIHLSARDDSSSLLSITAAQNALFSGTAEVGTTTIRVERLTEHVQVGTIAAPALLKLDVQGFELQALIGCEDLLEEFAWVYAECSFVELYAGQAFADEIIDWLRQRGFALRGVYHMVYDDQGRAVQADFLFGRPDTRIGD